MNGGFLLYLRNFLSVMTVIGKRTYRHGHYEDYVYCFLFLPCMAFPVAKTSLLATFYHGKGMKDTIKNHASHIKLGNEELMKYKP